MVYIWYKRKEMAVGRKDEEIQKIQLRRVRGKKVCYSQGARDLLPIAIRKKSQQKLTRNMDCQIILHRKGWFMQNVHSRYVTLK